MNWVWHMANTQQVSVILVSGSQARKPRPRDMKVFDSSHTADKQQGWDSNQEMRLLDMAFAHYTALHEKTPYPRLSFPPCYFEAER